MRKAVIASSSGGGPVAGQRKCSASCHKGRFCEKHALKETYPIAMRTKCRGA